MADSSAERSRRSRAHSSGDHSDCSPDRCPVLITQRARELSSVRAAVERYLPHIQPDCRACAVYVASAQMLADELDAGNRRLAGELRQTVRALDSCEKCGAVRMANDPLDELQRRRDGLSAPYAV